MYDPKGNGKDRTVQTVEFQEAEPPAHLRDIVHRYLNLGTRNALAEDFVEQPVLSQDTGRASRTEPFRYSLTGPRWKYFRIESRDGKRREERLYDLDTDPHELRDLARTRPEVAARLRKLLDAEIADLQARGRALRDAPRAAAAQLPSRPDASHQLDRRLPVS